MISICSQQCNYSIKRQRLYCFMSFAQNAEIHMSGKRRNSTIGPKWEDNYLHNENSVLLVASRLSSSSSSILSSTLRTKDQFNCSRKWRPLLDPVTTRSDKHACGKPLLTDHDKQATENREPANEMNEEDPTKGIPVWLQPFTVYPEDLERCVRTFLWKSELRFGLQDVQNLMANGKSQIWTKIWRIIQRTNYTIWRTGWISPKTPRKIKQKFINLERNYLLIRGILLVMLYSREEFGRNIFWSLTLKN